MLATPIPYLLLAVEGRVDFVVETNPWGARKQPKRGADGRPAPAARRATARQLHAFLQARK